MKEKNNEILISFSKIWFNIKKYWWICAATTVLACVVVVVASLTSYNASVEKSETEEEESPVKYEASTLVYMDEGSFNTSLSLEQILSNNKELNLSDFYAQFLSEYVKAYTQQGDLYNSSALLYSKNVMNQVSEVLKENNMDAYNPIEDVLFMEIKPNSRFYSVIVRVGNKDRAKLMADTATEVLLKEGTALFGFKSGEIMNLSVPIPFIYEANNKIVYIDSEEEEKLIEGFNAQHNVKSFMISSLLSPKKILLILVGIFSGIGIIFIFVLMDRKLRDRNEISFYFDIPYLGELFTNKNNKQVQYNTFSAILEGKCKQAEVKNLMIASSLENDATKEVIQEISNDFSKNKADITIVNGENIQLNPNSVRNVEKADGIVLVIKVNQDEISVLDKTITNLKEIGGNILGYVLYH